MSEPPPVGLNRITQAQLLRLREIAGPGPVLILTHENPDPDALSAGKTLAVLLKEAWEIPSRLIYSGLVGRAENVAMLNLVTSEWENADTIADWSGHSAIAMVDTQPGTGNNRLPPEIVPQIVFDHHRRLNAELEKVPFVDIQPNLGATASLVYLYLYAAGIEPDAKLATAILYGIQTDTRGLTRGNFPVDQAIYFKLLGLIDRVQLRQIERARLPREYYRALSAGLSAVIVHGRLLTAYLGEMHRPDFMADMADLLVRLENVRAVLCLGYHGRKMYLSMRTDSADLDAGLLLQRVVIPPGKAGGHGSSAGGQVPLEGFKADELAHQLEQRFIQMMGESVTGGELL